MVRFDVLLQRAILLSSVNTFNVVGMHDSLIGAVAQLFTTEETKEGLSSAGGCFSFAPCACAGA